VEEQADRKGANDPTRLPIAVLALANRSRLFIMSQRLLGIRPARVMIWVVALLVGFSDATAQQRTALLVQDAPLLLLPDRTRTPLLMMEKGVVVQVNRVEGEWVNVRVAGSRWGDRTGYVEARFLKIIAPAEQSGTPTAGVQARPQPVTPTAKASTGSQVADANSSDRGSQAPVKVARPDNMTRRGMNSGRLAVVVVNREIGETGYRFVMPGYVSSQGNSTANCFGTAIGSSATVNCYGSGYSTTSVVPPTAFSYAVTGATLSLRLPDNRIAVVNCDSKANLTEWSMQPRRSCRIPTGSRLDAEFDGDRAKLFWRFGVNAEKSVSETYTLIDVLAPVAPY
jgi:hypothetical protein